MSKLNHTNVSLAKSLIRIGAGLALLWHHDFAIAGLLLILAELLGIIEEVV